MQLCDSIHSTQQRQLRSLTPIGWTERFSGDSGPRMENDANFGMNMGVHGLMHGPVIEHGRKAIVKHIQQ